MIWAQLLSVMGKLRITHYIILVCFIAIGWLYFNNTILRSRQDALIAEKTQLVKQIESLTLKQKEQQEIIIKVEEKVKQISSTSKSKIKIIEREKIAPGCDNAIKYLQEKTNDIKWDAK